MITEKDTIKCEAVFNDTKTHRLLWKRVWDKDKPLACVITIHPSISDNIVMDTTTFLTVNGIANLEEFGGVILVNLFSLLTGKLQMRWARDIDINDPENDNYIKKAADDAAIVILAWGRGVAQNARISNRADQVVELLAPHKEKLCVINDGEKTHLHPLSPSCRNIVWKLEPFRKLETEEKDTATDEENDAIENVPT